MGPVECKRATVLLLRVTRTSLTQKDGITVQHWGESTPLEQTFTGY